MEKIKEQHIAQFRVLAVRMRKLLTSVRKYCPDANLYQECNSWNLMTGDSHDEQFKPRHDRVAATETIPHSDGGAW